MRRITFDLWVRAAREWVQMVYTTTDDAVLAHQLVLAKRQRAGEVRNITVS